MDTEAQVLTLAEGFNHSFEYKDEGKLIFRPKINNLCRLLRDHGINPLGSGCHGVAIDCGDYVLKLFNQHDAGYRAFLEFCLAYGESPYLPDVYWVLDISPLLCAVAIEKLNTAPLTGISSHLDRWDDSRAEDRNDYKMLQRFLEGKSVRRAMRKHWEQVTPEFYAFAATIREYADTLGGDVIYWDIHGGNVMFRGSQIVLTDPWC